MARIFQEAPPEGLGMVAQALRGRIDYLSHTA
jgi:hypothetical protein